MNISITVLAALLMWAGTTWAQGTGPAFNSPAGIASDGGFNLLIVDEGLDAVVQVNPVSGDRSVISDNNMGSSGVPFSGPVGIALQNASEAFIVDRNLDAVLSVDLSTGNRQLLSGCPIVTDPCSVSPVGSGLGFGDPVGIAILNPTSLLVVDIGNGRNALIQVNIATGNRTIISSPTVGSGPPFLTPLSVTASALGDIFVADTTLDAVVGVDPITGARSIISGCPQGDDPCPESLVGSGPAFLRILSIAAETPRSLIVTDVDLGAVVRVNIGTGDRIIVSDASTGQGPVFFNPVGLTVDSNGVIFVADAGHGAIFRVDPVSGNRSIVSKQTRLILSPPNGVYTAGQNFDVTLIIEGVGTMSNLSVLLDDTDVTNQFTFCSEEVLLPNGGGRVLQCPNATSVFNLQPGRHFFRAQLFLSVRGMSPIELNEVVTWDILATQ